MKAQAITSSRFWVYLEAFRITEYVFDYFGVWRYRDVQAITFSRIWVYLGVFRPAEHVFENYFGVPRHAKTQEMISTLFVVWIAILTVPGGFLTRRVRFWGMFRWKAKRWCPGNNFLANLRVPGRFFRPADHVFENYFCVSTRSGPGDNFVAKYSLKRGFDCTWWFFDPPSTFLRTVSVFGDTLMSRR